MNHTPTYMDVLQDYGLAFIIYYIVGLIPVMNAVKLFLKKDMPTKYDLAFDMVVHAFILLGLFLGVIFQIRIADYPSGTLYAGWVYRLAILVVVDVLATAIYCRIAFRRFRALHGTKK